MLAEKRVISCLSLLVFRFCPATLLPSQSASQCLFINHKRYKYTEGLSPSGCS
ncbi:hypothetical protein I79_017062 [Cricetulus griseus]|uniref:Uncharacterized protein n=1 Tax=Cricetulus griseus TaxID=10029 RepID=G3I119_CRIGR|nr:hypothetical protein I79_017062 [Cricetulus griseus]